MRLPLHSFQFQVPDDALSSSVLIANFRFLPVRSLQIILDLVQQAEELLPLGWGKTLTQLMLQALRIAVNGEMSISDALTNPKGSGDACGRSNSWATR